MAAATSGRFRSRPVEGEFARCDGTNASEIAAFAGNQYEGTDGDGRPRVRGVDGVLAVMDPGWVASRGDGEAGVIVSAPAAWAGRCEEIPGRS